MLASSTMTGGHDAVAATLACEIISGIRPTGSRMPTVEEMFARFGASRVLMREVTKTLAAKGLIVAKSRVGTLVLPPERWHWFDPDFLAWRLQVGLDLEFFRQLTEMRRAVEPAAAALAAKHRTPEVIAELRAALAEMHAAGLNRRSFAQADLHFHVALSAASRNPLFRSFASVVETSLSASLAMTAPLDESAMAEVIGRHATIAAAIEAGDSAEASRAMCCVIDEAHVLLGL